jgi:succinoglycan biosynthesis transport protein ExoP
VTDHGQQSTSISNPFQQLSLHEYWLIVKRRRPWVVLTAVTISVASAVFASLQPSIYKSQTVIVVDPQQAPSTFVTPAVAATVTDRLSTIRQVVLSPTRLNQLRNQLRLFPELNGPGTEERVAARMQNAIGVEVVDAGGQKLSAFKISYTSKNPKETAEVANWLATMVIEENLRAREKQSDNTRDFLETELDKTKRQLEQKESELQRIKTTFIMDLPESKQYHLEALNNYRNQLRTAQDRVARAQQEKIYINSLMASSSPTVDLDADTGGGLSPNEAQLQKLETTLADLRARYGPKHPDVRKTMALMDELKAKIEQDKKAIARADVAPVTPRQAAPKNPVLEAQLNQLNQEIDEQTKIQAKIQEQIDFHSSKLERIPIFEQQMVGLMRDYDTLRGYYNHLLDRKLAADEAYALENRQKAERFVVLDPARVPTRPAGPNRLLISLAGLMGGIFGGLGLAVLVEMTDESIRSEKEAAQIFGKAVLAGIPHIWLTREHRLKRLQAVGALATTVAVAVGLGALASYLTGRLG